MRTLERDTPAPRREMSIFERLEAINARPRPFEFYTASDLWTDEHTSEQMLKFHLDGEIDASSRSAAFIDRSVDWIASRFDVEGKGVADFGCGPGLYATRLAQRHAKVTGIDFSGRSIRYAREVADREKLSIRYENLNYLDFDTEERFSLIIMIMCDFCALSPVQRRRMLDKFHTFLDPDGSILLDVYSPSTFDEREEKALYEVNLLNGFWSPNKYYGFLNTFKYGKERLILDKYTLFEETGSRTIYNWFQCFSREELAGELVQAGFAVEALYSDVAGAEFSPRSREFAVVAGKH